MFEVLDRVRKKSQAEKQAIAFSVAAIVTGVIFIVWAISFFTSIKSEQKTAGVSEDSFELGSFVNSFQEAGNIIKKEVGSARDQFDLINSELQKTEGVEVVNPPAVGVKNTEELTDTLVTEKEGRGTEITPSGIEIIQVGN
ncbi:hypothetical protein ACFL6I_13495 [candidate division KSB1 bacterium]